ncbi:MAG: hypothetical protein ACYSWP_04740 [Planctomycetota bacterium]|jgi:hypothetical protein
MMPENTEATDQQKHEAAVELLNKLKETLYSDNISIARKAAHKLSWMQEDGLDILKGGLLGSSPRTTKKAAAYGLRNMHGRMKKLATEVLKQGLLSKNRTTKAASEKSLMLMLGITLPKKYNQKRRPSTNTRIREQRNRRRVSHENPRHAR